MTDYFVEPPYVLNVQIEEDRISGYYDFANTPHPWTTTPLTDDFYVGDTDGTPTGLMVIRYSDPPVPVAEIVVGENEHGSWYSGKLCDEHLDIGQSFPIVVSAEHYHEVYEQEYEVEPQTTFEKLTGVPEVRTPLPLQEPGPWRLMRLHIYRPSADAVPT